MESCLASSENFSVAILLAAPWRPEAAEFLKKQEERSRRTQQYDGDGATDEEWENEGKTSIVERSGA
jgi:hypothetical protein